MPIDPNNDAQAQLTKLRRTPSAFTSWQNALRFLQTGQHSQALSAYRILVQQFPALPQLSAELGVAAVGELEFEEADKAFQRALELAPGDANTLVFIGTQYYQMRRIDQAFACLKRAVEVDPKSAHARLTLASWLERTRRADEAKECLDAALALYPKEGRLRYFSAFLLHRKGLNKEAETALRNLLGDSLLPLDVQADANHLLAVILDGCGEYAEALAVLGRSKAQRSQIVNRAAMEQIYQGTVKSRRELLAALTPEMIRRWRDDAAETPSPHPLAIIAGSPRSGTTLLEQIIGANPEILVFDEPHAFQKEVVNVLHPAASGRGLSLETLNALTAPERAKFINLYFRSLLRETEEKPGARLMLEKNPSNTLWMHMWLRIFPTSKIVIALRDPRDIVISAYFQNIPVMWGNVSFLSLENTAKFYGDCMEEWLRLRELGGFDWIETRYEDLVGNLEKEGQRVTAFLGVPWHEAQAKFYEKAQRKFVHSPTYDEVTKPVHQRKVGRWEHYAEALAPLQPALEPFLRALGYA